MSGTAEGRRVVLSAIAAAELPAPTEVSFSTPADGRHILALSFANLTEGRAWADYLGASRATSIHGGRRWLDHRPVVWHGWRVQLHTSEDLIGGAR